MNDILQYTFMQRALLEGVLIGAVCAVMGVYVVLNGLSFIGAGISHATFAGVAIGMLLGVDPVITALVFSLAVALGIGTVSERASIRHDTSVGIFFTAAMAFGVMLLGFLGNAYVDVFGYLFGNVLAISRADIVASAVMAVVVTGTVIALSKEFLALSFDREMAAVMGLPVRTLSSVLLMLVSLTIVLSVKAVGAVLVSALLVTPAAAAFQLTRRFGWMMGLSIVFGVGSCVAGLLLSFAWDVPSGATIVLVSTFIFVAAWIFSPRRRERA